MFPAATQCKEANPDLCKELLELLLNIKIDRIEQPLAEHSLKTDYNSKGIRFDVYVKDGTGRCFDIEVQTTNRRDLARRSRYYQSLMDVDSLGSGAGYDDLKDGYVIFLCLDDPFGHGLPVYRFSNTCADNASISLNDGAHKIFYNAAKHGIMPVGELRSFFRFLSGAEEDGTAFSGRLAAMVEHAKTNGQWRQQFMTWEEEMKERARELAKELAEEEVKERARELAKELAEEEVKERVKEQVEEAATEAAEERAVETARNFLAMGLSVEKVAQGTGLPLAQVERLRQEAAAVEA